MTVFYDDFYSNSLTISNAPRFRGIFLGNFFGNFFWKFFSLKTHEPTVPAYVNQKKCKKGHQFNVNNYCRGLIKGFYHCALYVAITRLCLFLQHHGGLTPP
jgi:hypothetical protein